MKILLIGGTGAMGKPLARILHEKGDEVHITSRKRRKTDGRIRYFQGDGHNLQFLEGILSANSYDAVIDFMTYEPEAFRNNIPVLLKSTGQYFFLSSCRVYAQSELPLTEKSPRLLDVCTDPSLFETEKYAIHKAAEEDILKSCRSRNWTIIRPYLTYHNYRLQLGFYEKEHWLYRALNGRTVLFPSRMLDKKTTLTYGEDVAQAVALLTGCTEACGQTFQIASEECLRWRDVIEIYRHALKEICGTELKVQEAEQISDYYKYWPDALIKYDRIYDRRFDCSRLKEAAGKDCVKFQKADSGLYKCIREFTANPAWDGFYHAYEAWADRKAGEITPVWQIPGKRGKLRYLADRFL